MRLLRRRPDSQLTPHSLTSALFVTTEAVLTAAVIRGDQTVRIIAVAGMVCLGALFIWMYFIRTPRPPDYGIKKIFGGGQRDTDAADDEGCTIWDAIYRPRVKEYDILGLTLSETMKRAAALRQSAEDGGRIRVILLNSVYGFHTQLPETAHLINWPNEEGNLDEVVRLRRKIDDTLHFLQDIKARASAEAARRIQIRFASGTIFHSITRADNKMCVTHYLSGVKEQGQTGPSFLLYDGPESALFKRHREEFESLWREAIPIERAVLCEDRLQALLPYLGAGLQAYRAFLGNDPSLIPLPLSAIIFPTYLCRDTDGNRPCPSCTFSGFDDQEMAADDFEKVLHLLCIDEAGPRVHTVELSGGGEPLQHSKIDRLLQSINSVHEHRPNVRLGLLTNGIYADKVLDKLAVFDYVRVTIPEKYTHLMQGDAQWRSYRDILCRIRNSRKGKRMGIKLLVTQENQSRIQKLAGWALSELGAQHVKVKAVRAPVGRPSQEELGRLADELWGLSAKLGMCPDLVVDFPEKPTVSTHSCWISPLVAVIDPSLTMFKCCSIGLLPPAIPNRLVGVDFGSVQTFLNRWRSDEHLRMIKELDVRRVCNSDRVADCRFVEYQGILQNIFAPVLALRDAGGVSRPLGNL